MTKDKLFNDDEDIDLLPEDIDNLPKRMNSDLINKPHQTKHGHKSHVHHHDEEHRLKSSNKRDFIGDKDPLLIYETEVAEDYYALIWCALKKEIWAKKSIYGVAIFLTKSDYFCLVLDFMIFASLISFTICIMVYQTYTTSEYKFGNWRIELLRILIVSFAQKLLYNEFLKGSTKFRYTLRHMQEFNYPWFAAFVPFWQCLMSITSYILIVIFMCISNEALPLVMHFAEVAILIELDDWIGESICKEFPDDEGTKPDDVELGDLNNELHLFSKLSLVREDLSVISDYNLEYDNSFFQFISVLISYFPWFLMPLISTLGFEAFVYYVRPSLIS
jgi:hypothetical protein